MRAWKDAQPRLHVFSASKPVFAWCLVAAACPLLILIGGCGSSTPSPVGRLPFTPGATYILIVDQGQQCTGSRLEFSLGSHVSLSKEGSDWVVRSSLSKDGNVVMRFRETERTTSTALDIEGTATGRAEDFLNASSAITASVTLSGPGGRGNASVSGGMYINHPVTNTLYGRLEGQVAFASSSGGTMTCRGASFAFRERGDTER